MNLQDLNYLLKARLPVRTSGLAGAWRPFAAQRCRPVPAALLAEAWHLGQRNDSAPSSDLQNGWGQGRKVAGEARGPEVTPAACWKVLTNAMAAIPVHSSVHPRLKVI